MLGFIIGLSVGLIVATAIGINHIDDHDMLVGKIISLEKERDMLKASLKQSRNNDTLKIEVIDRSTAWANDLDFPNV